MTGARPPLVVLDRDGVINVDVPGQYVCSAEQWEPIDGSLGAIARLSRAGIPVYVVSNQSGIGRGLFDADELARMHAKLLAGLAAQGGQLAGWFYCPHTPEAHCHCRKPAPGLLEAVAGAAGRSLDGVPLIGDKWTDMLAGQRMRMRCMLVATGHGRATLAAHRAEVREYFPDLAAAVQAVLAAPRR